MYSFEIPSIWYVKRQKKTMAERKFNHQSMVVMSGLRGLMFVIKNSMDFRFWFDFKNEIKHNVC